MKNPALDYNYFYHRVTFLLYGRLYSRNYQLLIVKHWCLMLNSIKVPLKTEMGNGQPFELIPELLPGVNGRQSITGVFKIVKKHYDAAISHVSAEYVVTIYGNLVFIK
jgi:hypothetical protein